MYACHDWNGWDFYPAMIPFSKLSPLDLISWKCKGGYGNVFLQKRTLKLSTLAPILSCAAFQSKETVFACRSQCTNNQRSQRTSRVSTNPGTGVENKSYGNVAKFWGRVIMSTWNSVQGSLDWNPCGQKWISLITCKLNPQTIFPHQFKLVVVCFSKESALFCLCQYMF